MAFSKKDWMDAADAAIYAIVREPMLDLAKAVRAVRRKVKGKKREELEHCVVLLAAVRDRVATLARSPEMTAPGVVRGLYASLDDIDYQRCLSVLMKEFPEVPREALGRIQMESIHWYYLR